MAIAQAIIQYKEFENYTFEVFNYHMSHGPMS